MRQRKKNKNKNGTTTSSTNTTNKPSVTDEEMKKQTIQVETRTRSGSSSSTPTSSSNNSGIEAKNNNRTNSNQDVNASESDVKEQQQPQLLQKKETTLTVAAEEKNSSSFSTSSSSTSSSSSPSSSTSTSNQRKLSELKTIRIPSLSEQKPPLPPPHCSHHNRHHSHYTNNQPRPIEKSRSSHSHARMAADDLDWKNRSQQAVFRSSSLKAFVRIPSVKEMETLKQEQQQPHKHKQRKPVDIKQTLIPISASIKQILTDFTNYQRMNNNVVSYPSPLERTLKQGCMGAPDGIVHVKKYKKVPPTPANTRKLVAQVLRDLVALYKTEKSQRIENEPPRVESKPPPPTATRTTAAERKPVEIKIRKIDDKIVIKSNEPVIINTTPDVQPSPKRQPSTRTTIKPKSNGILRNEYKLKTSSSVDSCVVGMASSYNSQHQQQQQQQKQQQRSVVTKTTSSDSLSTVIVQGPGGPKRVRYLGVVDADPVDYARRYKNELCPPSQLPEIVKLVKTPGNMKLAAETGNRRKYELEGDLEVFKYVNLEKVGMTEYKEFLESKGIKSKPTMSGCELVSSTTPPPAPLRVADAKHLVDQQVEGLSRTLDTNNDGLINPEDAERHLPKLNTTYGRCYGETESRAFYEFLSATENNKSSNHQLDLKTVKRAFGLQQAF